MTTSPFDLALSILLNGAIGIILLGHARQSLRQGYAVGLWWDFQRESEPKRFWAQIVFVVVAAIGEFWVTIEKVVVLSKM